MTSLYNQTTSGVDCTYGGFEGDVPFFEMDAENHGHGPTILTYLAGALYLVSLTFAFSRTLHRIPQVLAIAWAIVLFLYCFSSSFNLNSPINALQVSFLALCG